MHCQTSSLHTDETVIHAALELSKNSWLLAIEASEHNRPSLHHLKGGDSSALLAKLHRACEQFECRTGNRAKIVLCYEAGYDGFWLARLLENHGIDCLVVDPASLQVDRRARRVKTDRIDVEAILRTVIAWRRGERHVCSLVHVPSRDEEDLRRSHRERDRLVKERTAHTNRIKGLLFTQGIRDINLRRRRKPLVIDFADLVTGDGRCIPPRLKSEVERELQRLALVDEQLAIAEAERDQVARQCEDSEKKRHQLALLRGVGETGAAILVREVFYRTFSNRRQVGSYLGLAPCPYDSGSSTRSHGISKAGNARARSTMIELAWFWLRYQPDSQLTLWFERRVTGQSKRIRRIMIVALARKLAIAFWRYVETGLVPSGAIVAKV